MNQRELISVSKFLSLILRHNPQKAEVTLDANGWVDVAQLIEGMNKHGRVPVTLDDLKLIVRTDDKQRYVFSDDGSKIRANQGHSVNVDVELTAVEPPDILYHGTATRFLESIKDGGLIASSRLYVHLSADAETAVKVGKRHGEPVVLGIEAGEMHARGYPFYLSANGVWLTACVPSDFICRI